MQGISRRLKAHVEKCHEKDNCVGEIRTPSLSKEAVELNTQKYGFKVVAFVTGNTGNVTKLRRNLRFYNF